MSRCLSIGLLTLLTPLLLAQNCAMPPGQLAPAVQNGIPEGLYTGVATMTTVITVYPSAERVEGEPDTFSVSKPFGPDGVLLTVQNTPAEPGDVVTQTMGEADAIRVIYSVSTGPNRCVIRWDTTMTMDVPDIGTVELTGWASDTYEWRDGALQCYSTWRAASNSIDGVWLLWEDELTATLYP